jgi:biopolymer transport protein ExbD
MGKVKVKKQSTFIDMTAMSDVTVLLLTFFMLTSTFVAKEPITVNTPASVSEKKVPEADLLTILVDDKGKIFLSMDNGDQLSKAVEKMGSYYSVAFTPAQLENAKKLPSFGVPIKRLPEYLNLKVEEQDKFMKEALVIENNPNVGIPNSAVDTTANAAQTAAATATPIQKPRNEFQNWIIAVREVTKENKNKMKLAIKADKTTDYEVIKQVINDLRDLHENRYLLVTNLRTASSD